VDSSRPRAKHILSKYTVWHLYNRTDPVKEMGPMPLNFRGWSHRRSIPIMCLCAFHHLCHTWKYCWNLLLGILYVTLLPCRDCLQVIQNCNVSRKLCQKSPYWKVCVGRCIINFENPLGAGGEKSLHDQRLDVLVFTFTLLFALLSDTQFLFFILSTVWSSVYGSNWMS
jgi:hypothetical protein